MDTQISNLYLPDSDKDEEIKKRVLTVLVDKEISGEGHEQIDIQISNLHLPDSDRDEEINERALTAQMCSRERFRNSSRSSATFSQG